MKKNTSVRWLTWMAWAGIALVLLTMVMTRFVRQDSARQSLPSGKDGGVAVDQNIPLDEPLGELNSHCGGPLRLPCRPGLMCSVNYGETEFLGTCIKQVNAVVQDRQLNESCEREQPCVPGLYCAPGESGNACKVLDLGAPKGTSLKLEGMQFDHGAYQAVAGQNVPVRVVAVNASAVTLRLRPNGQAPQVVETLKSSTGGNFSGSFVAPAGFMGSIEVLVDGENGTFSVLSALIEVGR